MYGIFTYIWVICSPNVGKYSSTMEHMGKKSIRFSHLAPPCSPKSPASVMFTPTSATSIAPGADQRDAYLTPRKMVVEFCAHCRAHGTSEPR